MYYENKGIPTSTGDGVTIIRTIRTIKLISRPHVQLYIFVYLR